MANFIGRLGVVLGLDSAEFSRGIDAAGKRLDVFAAAAVSAGKTAALALVAAGVAAARYADEIADTAKANDVAIDSILKLRNALAVSGGSAENAGKLMSAFTASIDKAAEGGFETQKVFKTLGLSIEDLRKMDMDGMFNKSVAGLAAMTDPITRNAKAMELFGKAAKGVDFVGLNEEIKSGAGVTDDQAKGIQAAADAFDIMGQRIRNAALILSIELGPTLKTTLEYMDKILPVTDTVGKAFGVAFKGAALAGATLVMILQNSYDLMSQIIASTKILLNGGNFDDIKKLNQQTSDVADERLVKLEQFYRDILGKEQGAWRGMRNDDSKPASTGNRRSVKPGVDKEAEAAAKKILDLQLRGFMEAEREREANRQAFSDRATFLEQGEKSEIMRQKIGKMSLDREKEMLILQNNGKTMRDEELQYAQSLLKIEWQRKDAIELINTNDALTQTTKKEALERNNALAQQAIDLEKTRLDIARQSREGGIGQGFMFAADATFRNAKTEFERGGQMFDSVMGNMQASLDNFVRTGKLSFKDLTRTIIQGLISIQLQAQMLSMFKGLGSLFSGGGGGGGFMNEAGGMELPGSLGFANGGDPPLNQASWVGERGPELFVPKTAGTIIPNNALASMGGGGQTVNYNGPYIASMSAIDTQSGLQFLAKNKASVWSAYQSANRSIPMSR